MLHLLPWPPGAPVACARCCTMGIDTSECVRAQAGRITIIHQDSKSRLTRWVLWGLIFSGVAAALCGVSQNGGIIPINKNLWSPSFVCAMAGTGVCLCVCVCARGWRRCAHVPSARRIPLVGRCVRCGRRVQGVGGRALQVPRGEQHSYLLLPRSVWGACVLLSGRCASCNCNGPSLSGVGFLPIPYESHARGVHDARRGSF